MHLGYISRWKASYTLDENGLVYMNLTHVDPGSEICRLRAFYDEQPNAQDQVEIMDLIGMLNWAIACPLRYPILKYKDALFTIRYQGMEHVNTDVLDLPVVQSNLTVEQVQKWAREKNLTWVAQRGWLFGGYYRDKDGNYYYLV
jgi:hypothetical protein